MRKRMNSKRLPDFNSILTLFVLSLMLLFGAAFSCGQANLQRRESSRYVKVDQPAKIPAATTVDDLSGLPGTDWAVLPYQTMPDIFAFCPSGRWELQSSAAFGGRYQVSGKRIVMKLDDGSTYADCSLAKREGNEIYLSCGSDNLHLRYHGKVNCK